MQKQMLTEDIDSSMRAIISGARIEYDLKVLSYELAPETLSAFNKQRLRWAQGWTQVAVRHFMPAFRRGAYSDNNGWRSRIGLLQLLAYREFYFYINTQLLFILLVSIFTCQRNCRAAIATAARRFVTITQRLVCTQTDT